MKKTKWYVAGLHFECAQCGRCCSGPDEGYIWVTKPEIKLIADYLNLSLEQLRQKYLRRIGWRTTIIEEPLGKDCIFLKNTGQQKVCTVYPVRPNQCRNWPFWPSNLSNARAWNEAAQKCPGINRGRCYKADQIEQIKKRKQWWPDEH